MPPTAFHTHKNQSLKYKIKYKANISNKYKY